MRKVILFIAMSLDGYIAGRAGNVDWLQGQEPDKDDMESYQEFIKGIDTVVIGWNTYEQIVTELSPEEWIYQDLNSYVVTHRDLPDTEAVKFVNDDVCRIVAGLKQEEGKDIWICGGAAIIRPLLREKLIDRLHISVIPTILGGGIRLFGAEDAEMKLRLVKTQSYNGITDLIYEWREKGGR